MCVSSSLARSRTLRQSWAHLWPLPYLSICAPSPPPWWETEHSCAAGLLLDLSQFDHVCLKAPGGPHNIVVRQTTMVDTTLFEWVRSKAPSAKQNSPVAQGSVLHITLVEHVCFEPLW